MPPRTPAVRRLARTLLVTLVAGVAACGSPADAAWNRGEAVAQLVAERARRANAETVNLRDLAPFRWERMHLLPPGAAAGAAAAGGAATDALGPAWPAIAAAAPAGRPDAQLLVFTAAGDVVAAAALAPDAARFDDALLGRSFASDSAAFAVSRAGDAPPRLSRPR